MTSVFLSPARISRSLVLSFPFLSDAFFKTALIFLSDFMIFSAISFSLGLFSSEISKIATALSLDPITSKDDGTTIRFFLLASLSLIISLIFVTMRIALISDVHSNLEALLAVLNKIDSMKINDVYCLGDIVGYGADPKEVIKILTR